MYLRYQCTRILWYKLENDEVWGMCLVNVLVCVTYWNISTCLYLYILQIAKRRASPVFVFNMLNTTKHSTRSGIMCGCALHAESSFDFDPFLAMLALSAPLGEAVFSHS